MIELVLLELEICQYEELLSSYSRESLTGPRTYDGNFHDFTHDKTLTYERDTFNIQHHTFTLTTTVRSRLSKSNVKQSSFVRCNSTP